MTRYSRSVIPGRPSEDGDQDGPSLDGIVFGSKKKPITAPANDRENDYPDPMDMDVDEAGFLVDRATTDRRSPNGNRRKTADRRAKDSGRRHSDFTPLREPGASHRHVEGNGRGPILLVAAILIVAVFGVVVWNAYREGVRTDDPDATPALSTAGSFKTPPRETSTSAVQTAEIEPLDGGPLPVIEERPQPAPAVIVPAAEVAPAPPKFTAPPPAPLKQPEIAKPATLPAATAPTSAATAPAKADIDLPKPSAPARTPIVTAAAPAPAAPAPAAVAPAGTFKPAFAAGGAWLVQVAAPSSEAGALTEWDKRVKALPEFFASAERFVVHADVNGKSVYRLRAGSFASKADADAFCAAYKAKGGNCFPAAK